MADDLLPPDPPNAHQGAGLPPADAPQPPADAPSKVVPFQVMQGGKQQDDAAAVQKAKAAAEPTPAKPLPAPDVISKMSLQQRCEFIYSARVDGWTWHRLSVTTGRAVATLQRDYEKRTRQLADESAREERRLANERLTEAARGVMPGVRRGDTESVLALVKVEERRARMYGYDAPLKVASTTPDGTQWAPLAVEQLAQLFTVEQLDVLELAQRAQLRLTSGALDAEVVPERTEEEAR